MQAKFVIPNNVIKVPHPQLPINIYHYCKAPHTKALIHHTGTKHIADTLQNEWMPDCLTQLYQNLGVLHVVLFRQPSALV